MRTLRIILVLLAVAAVTPSTFSAYAGQGKGGRIPGCAKSWFPATGQTAAYTADTQTGQGVTVPDDATVRAGAPLRYTDNGDGTITDNNTGLMWEKKGLGDGTLHNALLAFFWSFLSGYGPSIWDWLAAVNAEGGNGFAGYNDWRIPNARELASLVDYGIEWHPYVPFIAPAFTSGCVSRATVLTGSCTGGQDDATDPFYWSSTTINTPDETIAVSVDFSHGVVWRSGKLEWHSVRAVRGGCLPSVN